MELDDFKELGRKVQPTVGDPTGENDPLKGLIGRLKETDAKDRKALLIIMVMFSSLCVIYLSLLITKQGMMKSGFALLVGAFLCALAFIGTKLRRHRKIDYSAPVLLFLKEAERRYTCFDWRDVLVSIPLLIAFGTAGGLIVYSSFQKYFPGSLVPLIIYFVIFLAAVAVGMYSSREQWIKGKKGIYDEIRRLRQELQQ